MKKTFIKLPLFLLFIFALILGLSYISLDQPSSSQADQTSNDMSIALVNEDDGAVFNGEQLDFGTAFVQSLNQNYGHEWYVVSRGVAENGLQNNTYDMMIIIPKDFTRKALSIDSDTPEQVELKYKINAADSESVRAQAEETASTILNDFNRRIIDVYFASIIGNLQDAQDNVAKIVEEYEGLTGTYRQSIHQPLSTYTAQFGQIKSNTELSKDSFSGFENTLDGYEATLAEQLGSFENYQSNINDVQDTKQSNSLLNQSFAEKLSAFQYDLNHQDANQTLKNIQDFNQYINFQFRKGNDEENQLNNIAFHSRVIQHRLNQALDSLNQDIENYDIKSINEGIRERLAVMVEEAFDGEDQMTRLLESQQTKARERIEDLIANLPTLNEEQFAETDLSPEITREIDNVIQVTKKYKDEFRNVWSHNDDVILPEYVQDLKENLHTNGYTMTDTVMLPETDKPLRELQIFNIPEGFFIDRLSVVLPDGEKLVFNDYQENEIKTLPDYLHGEFTIALTLKLEEEFLDQPIDIYEMKQWEWRLHQSDQRPEEEQEEGASPEEKGKKNKKGIFDLFVTQTSSSKNENVNIESQKESTGDTADASPIEQDGNEQNQSGKNTEDVKNEEGTPDAEEPPLNNETEPGKGEELPGEETKPNEEGETPGEETNPGDEEGPSDGEEPGDGTTPPGEEDDEKPNPEIPVTPPVEEIIIENDYHHYYIHHKVKSPMIDEPTEKLVHAVEATVAPYQKLLTTYEAYFGLKLSCYNIEDENCEAVDRQKKLTEMITEDSLYTLFQKDIGELLTDYIADQVIADVRAELREPLYNYERKLKDQQSFINQTLRESDQLAEKVVESRNAAQVLNDNLEQLLEEVADWRKQVEALTEDNGTILSHLDQEQTLVMSLNEGFQPLLQQSQSLKEQASSNLAEADTVYQSFDRIDNQANEIQESGSNLVQQAETLADNLTNKLSNDQEFVENFTSVMANSRIGERPNEDLYEFLSNPVETKNEGVIIETSQFTPYFLVLISALAALFTGYGISTFNQRRKEDDFEQEQSLVAKNTLLTAIIGAIGVVEGILLGLVSGYLLQIEGGRFIIWTLLMILIMTTSVLVASYLLRQLKMIGMFIILAVISMYLFLTDALSASISGVSAWRDLSPLHYIERLMRRAVQSSADYGLIVLSLIFVALIAVVANLLVVSKRKSTVKSEDESDVA